MITNVEPLQHVKLLQVNLIKVFFYESQRGASQNTALCILYFAHHNFWN